MKNSLVIKEDYQKTLKQEDNKILWQLIRALSKNDSLTDSSSFGELVLALLTINNFMATNMDGTKNDYISWEDFLSMQSVLHQLIHKFCSADVFFGKMKDKSFNLSCIDLDGRAGFEKMNKMMPFFLDLHQKKNLFLVLRFTMKDMSFYRIRLTSYGEDLIHSELLGGIEEDFERELYRILREKIKIEDLLSHVENIKKSLDKILEDRNK